jgi:hypothetical protein
MLSGDVDWLKGGHKGLPYRGEESGKGCGGLVDDEEFADDLGLVDEGVEEFLVEAGAVV